MVKQSVSERRSSIRAKRVLSIQFCKVKTGRKSMESAWHLSTTYDMSVGGIAFYTDQELRVGDVVELEVVMSGVLDIYKGLGKVVRVERKKGAAHLLIALKLISKKENGRQAKSYISRSPAKKSSRKARRYN